MAFLSLDCKEGFYGGAAGGGKSSALLMWALEGVDTPGYTAILFRRTFPELSQSGGFIPRSHEWLRNTPAHWNGTDRTWTFPSGARLTFGSMQHEQDKYKYHGGEYTRAGFDELTHFSETQYEWIMTRLRRIKGFSWMPQIRSGANPGGVGHLWVKNRFVSDEAMQAVRENTANIHWKDGRAFVPARLDDNPHLEQAEYEETLQSLPPVLRARLLAGDWSVVEDALISAEWLSYYEMQGQIIRGLDRTGKRIEHGQIDERECKRFCTVDTAGTTEQKEAERKGKPSSWSVCATWDYWPKRKWLFLRHVWRKRVAFMQLCDAIQRVNDEWKPQHVYVENAHLGPAVMDSLRGKMPIRGINPVTAFMKGQSGKPGKVERATPLLNKLDRGEVFLPAGNNDWLPDLEAEWLSWMGLKDEQSDQIDVASYAATVCDDWRGNRLTPADFGVGVGF
jgi:phage terminase large subunit-like protein